jgi:hypothetical protein
MSTPAQPGTQKMTAPYVPFKSFITGLDYLRQGLPHVLDRSAWPTFSGGLSGQMLATFRFLGLITEEYESTPLLERAVDPDKRKDAIREAVSHGYNEMVGMDLSRATPKQLGDFLGELYNVTGATHKKAMTFFLHAAKFIELPLSPSITRKTRNSGPRRRRAAGSDGAPPLAPSPQPQPNGGSTPDPAKQQKGGSSRTISLRGGGSATVSFDVDVWSMTPEDQKFVFGLIKSMTDYEQQSSAPTMPTTEESAN